jgi:uncharacterized protein (DUF1800 family)
MSLLIHRRHFIGGAASAALTSGGGRSAYAAQAMGFDEARHVVSRTSFGVTPARIRSLEPLAYDAAIDGLLRGRGHRAMTPPPAWIGDTPKEASDAKATLAAEKRSARAAGGKAVIQPGHDQRRDLQFWWMTEMLSSEQPLVERMVLFWHNHFTSSLKKVKYMPAMYRQNELFRREALGNFGTLLKEVARDPAMLAYLDGARSVARQPNENFARELLELFTLGEGNYGEADIKAAARAFTGWSTNKETGRFVFHADRHDDGHKTFLGKVGRLGGDDVLNILLADPRTSRTVVEKLWREFVSLAPEPAEVARLAKVFLDGGYEMKPLLRAMFLSETFRDPANRGALIKSPLDFVLGAATHLGISAADDVGLLRMLQGLGQVPFDPPNVKGWPGGERWITSYTLLLRQQFARRMIEATQVTSARVASVGAKKMADGAKRRGNKPATSPGMDRDDITMQLPDESRMLEVQGMAVRLPPVLIGVDSAEMMRVLLPIEPVEVVDLQSTPGAVAAAAVLDVSYQLR